MLEVKRLFISYDSKDFDSAMGIYEDLVKHRQEPWIDKSKLLGGDDWSKIIPPIIQNETDYFLMILSKTSIKNNRYFRKEFELAIARQETLNSQCKFIIPIRIDDCELPESVKKFQVLNIENRDYRSIYHAIGVNTLKEKYGFIDGTWAGYTIEDVRELGGQIDEVFPFVCDFKIDRNIIEGSMSISYKHVGPSPSSKLQITGHLQKDTIHFHWNNADKEVEQGGLAVLRIDSENKLVGRFSASGIDSKTSHGVVVFHKVEFDVN